MAKGVSRSQEAEVPNDQEAPSSEEGAGQPGSCRNTGGYRVARRVPTSEKDVEKPRGRRVAKRASSSQEGPD